MRTIVQFFVFLCLSPVLASAAATTPLGPPPPPEDAVVFDEHHYRLVDEVEDLSWTSAKEACEADGAHLAVVTSAREAAFIA